MITSSAFAGKRYAVLGLARSGAATVRALLASGASVTAWDADEGKRGAFLPGTGRGTAEGGGGVGATLETSPNAAKSRQPLHHPADGPPPRSGADLVLADPLLIDLAGFDGIVVSPGVPLNTHPIAARAKAAGVPVIGDIELFALARPSLPAHKVVGITGTNGKSTTTALIHHILETAGVPTTMGGNIGLPILAQEPLPEGGVYVLELSSFQIDLTFSLDCDVAVLTNITPDHLDRYRDFWAYAVSKFWLFKMSNGVAVIAGEDGPSRSLARSICRPGLDPWGDAVDQTEGGMDVVRAEMPAGLTDLTDQSRWPTLQGPHNMQNVACATSACWALGLVSLAEIAKGLETYPGLPHRMQRVAEIDGVLYVNDSKATNATSTAPALGAYPKIHWILGGRRKTDDLDACAPFYDHVVAGYAIGEATELYARILGEAGIAAHQSGTLETAVAQAHAAARPGETVLLSPACASYDQFSDYEARGAAFCALVAELSHETGRMA